MTSMWNCRQCGAENPADAVQCRKCGALNYDGGGAEEPDLKRTRVEQAPPPPAEPQASDPFPFALVGKNIEIHGLANKPELNGARGVVKDFDSAANRYTIEVPGSQGGSFRLRRENLQEISAQTPQAQQQPAARTSGFSSRAPAGSGWDVAPEVAAGIPGMMTTPPPLVGIPGTGGGGFNGGIIPPDINPAAPASAGFVAMKKTQMCTFFQSGVCGKGKDCTFAHGEHELNKPIRAGPPQLHPEGSYIMGYNRMVIKTINFPNHHKGALIGSGGKQIAKIRQETGAHASVDVHPDDGDLAVCTFRGTWQQIDAAEKLVQENLAALEEQDKNKMIVKTTNIPKDVKGAIIGSGGRKISAIRHETGAFCSVDPHPTLEQFAVLSFRGIWWQIDAAEQMCRDTLINQGIEPHWDPPVECKPPKMQDPSTGRQVTVCTFFLKGFCCYGDQCNKAHIQPPAGSKEMLEMPIFTFGLKEKKDDKSSSWRSQLQQEAPGSKDLAGDSGAGWSAEDLAELGITGLDTTTTSSGGNKPNEAGWTKTASNSVAGWTNSGSGGRGGDSWQKQGGWQGGGGGWQGSKW